MKCMRNRKFLVRTIKKTTIINNFIQLVYCTKPKIKIAFEMARYSEPTTGISRIFTNKL